MRGIIKTFFVLFSLSAFGQEGVGSDFCGIKNTAFHAGEIVTMKVFYNALGVYVGAGEAVFTTSLERFNGKAAYHCVGEGKNYSVFDNFFKVRDRYETYIDTATMLPIKFIRNVDEGGHKIYNNVTFNQGTGTAVSTAITSSQIKAPSGKPCKNINTGRPGTPAARQLNVMPCGKGCRKVSINRTPERTRPRHLPPLQAARPMSRWRQRPGAPIAITTGTLRQCPCVWGPRKASPGRRQPAAW